ncbi:MAG: RNA-guided pseudouridylation complex pseudouridine synthase subunit Cbf5 [Candidatus Micrarchaeota archaeon]
MANEIILKKEFPVDPKFGKSPTERTVDELLELGIAVIDKPCGPSSHEVSAWVKRILSANKSGHSGTLDPRVSGVLPVGANRSSKAMSYLAKSDKEYVCAMRYHEKLSEEKIRGVMGRFVGELTQLPPVRSAVARRPRKRKVYYLNILEVNSPEVLFVVGCQAGTYVRKLCFDMGRLAGRGAHMSELRRTKAGVFSEKDSHSLQDLSDAYWLWKEKGDESEIRKCVIPFEASISARKIWVADQAVEALCSGAPLAAPGISKLEKGFAQGDDVAIFTLKGELVSFGKALVNWESALSMEKGLVSTTDRVMMKKGTYPRCW